MIEGASVDTVGASDADEASTGGLDVLRAVAVLRSHQVRFVVVGSFAAMAHGAPVDPDRLEVCVTDDETNLTRLGMSLQGLQAEQGPATDDPHRAVFSTTAGTMECIEVPLLGGFAELEASAVDLDLGQGVHALVAPPLDLPDQPGDDAAAQPDEQVARTVAHAAVPARFAGVTRPEELVAAVRAAALEDDEVPDFLRDDGDEFGPERLEGREPPWRRLWRAFEDVDRFLSGVTEGIGTKGRERR